MKTDNLFLMSALIAGLALVPAGRLSAQTIVNIDGANPNAGLVQSGNTLYGTTATAGPLGYGTVFAVNTDGTGFTVLHTFGSRGDGTHPWDGLILSGNTLYGTAYAGGAYGYGTIFSINTDGTGYTNLHSFSYSEGGWPIGGLILSSNTLYGTTRVGGAYGSGTVFSLTLPPPPVPVVVRINDFRYPNPPVVTVEGTTNGWNFCPCANLGVIDPANEDGGLITLFGVDSHGSINEPNESGWRLLDPAIVQPVCRSAVDIVWIQHDPGLFGNGDLQIAFNSAFPGRYYSNPDACPSSDVSLGPLTYKWQLVYSNATVVVLFKESGALTPPNLTCAGPLTLECSNGSATGAVVANVQDSSGYTIEVVWTVDGVPYQTNQIPFEGDIAASNVTFTANFSLGEHVVTVSASNGLAPLATCSTAVSVRDTTPPVVTCPGNIVAVATSPAGATVSFASSASDTCSAASVTSAPASGGTFAIGDTTVTCTARDGSGNQAICNFTVHVKSAAEQVNDLMGLTQSMGLDTGTANSLVVKLQGAASALDRGNINAACGVLGALLNEASGQEGKNLTAAQTHSLTAEATRIRVVLGCN